MFTIALISNIIYFVCECFQGLTVINFNIKIFKIAYALTSRGDLKKKLEYAFMLYDLDGSGYLNNNELKTVLGGMLDLLGSFFHHFGIKLKSHTIFIKIRS